MKKIQRYLPILKKKKNEKDFRATVQKDPYGKYVLFEEHARRVARLQNDLASEAVLRKRIRDLEEEVGKLHSYAHYSQF